MKKITKKSISLKVVIAAGVLGLAYFIFFQDQPNTKATEPIPTQPNLKVAFIGDSGYRSNFISVLNLIKSEGAEAVFHQGDFDYADNPDAFFTTIDSVLGSNFPYFGAVGNHDVGDWNDGCGNQYGCYATFLKNRMTNLGITPDDPNLNDQMYSVDYKGLKVVFTGQDGVSAGDGVYAPYIQQQFGGDSHIWKICAWHKLQEALQIGGKSDEMGWNVYETCRNNGAIIATAHEHSYERTKSLISMVNQTVDTIQHPIGANGVPGNPNELIVYPGRTFAFVSGLGGNSVRNQERCLPTTYPYGCNYEWGKIYTSNQGAKYGALFITFNVNGDPNKANAYFKNINGQIIDQFTITASDAVVTPPPPPPADVTPPVVSITSPANQSTVVRRSSVTINATASDDVSVTKVEFYVNNSLVCTDSASPYSCNWSVPSPAGRNYTLKAQAYDLAGNTGSAVVTVTSR